MPSIGDYEFPSPSPFSQSHRADTDVSPLTFGHVHCWTEAPFAVDLLSLQSFGPNVIARKGGGWELTTP
mgnify:CR=1 FL=1